MATSTLNVTGEEVRVAPFVGPTKLTDNCPLVCWNFAVSVMGPFMITVAGLLVPVKLPVPLPVQDTKAAFALGVA